MIKKILPILFLAAIFTSCLEYNLPELPVFEDADVLDFKLEYRYFDEEDGVLVAKAISSPVTIDTLTNAIEVAIKSSGTIKKLINDKGMTLQNIVGYATISAGATIYPTDNAPILGVPSDYSSGEYTYDVVAADGITTKTWKVIVVPNDLLTQ